MSGDNGVKALTRKEMEMAKVTATVRIRTIEGGVDRFSGQPTGGVFYQWVASWTEKSGKVKEERGNKYLELVDAISSANKWSAQQNRPIMWKDIP